MKSITYKAASRGYSNHGWLDSYHTFSFANYHNPDRVSFGALRVVNDDIVTGGQGFGKHPHSNMEIVSIPLYGSLEHQDSMGNTTTIKAGEIQLMSAGTGIFHSEYNPDPSKPVNFFQLWIIPNRQGVEPRYAQKTINLESTPNQLAELISPEKGEDSMWLHQDAWLSMGVFEEGAETEYTLHNSAHGVFIMTVDGSFEAGEEQLELRDAVGIWEVDKVKIKATTPQSKILIIEVPMGF